MKTHRVTVIDAQDSPRIIFVEQLSELIGKAVSTIRICSTNQHYTHLIPRPFKLPHSRRLCWYEHEVMAWIASTKTPEPMPLRRPRGRPTKAQQLARQQRAESSTARTNA